MKKTAVFFLVILLTLTHCCAIAENMDEQAEENAYQELYVGNPTPIRGDFFTDLFGSGSSDMDVRRLLHGYNLILWDSAEGLFTTDPSVVTGTITLENDDGDRSYVFALDEDLFYSDGTQITAWDYAFSILLQISPEFAQTGAVQANKDYLLGCAEYLNGVMPCLEGVRVLSDFNLMITIRHEYLPFFYEMGLYACVPYPIHIIAPGVKVKDNGAGVYLANEDETVSEPVFTAELLQKTVMDPETGYHSHPSVVSGPYTLTSWDGETAVMEINPYYKGNHNGVKPTISKLIYTSVKNEEIIDKLSEGELGLVNKVTVASTIMDGMTVMTNNDLRMSAYPRAGLSFLSFCCDRDTVASQAVRQAIAWCFDREQLMADYVDNYGLLVNSYYGIGQWMYGIIQGTVPAPVDPPENENDKKAMAEYENELKEWEALSLDDLTAYTVDLDAANKLLDQDGWTLNAEGIREKEINGAAVTLDLKLAYSSASRINESIEKYLTPYLAEVGIRLTLIPMDINELLTRYYAVDHGDVDMFFLASNFDVVYDPSANFRVNGAGEHTWAYTNLPDEALYEHALAMRNTAPGEVLEYVKQWIEFQKQFNEDLPMIPLYSNIYFDFYTSELQEYYISENISWGDAIVEAYLGEEAEEEGEFGGEDEFGDEDMEFFE